MEEKILVNKKNGMAFLLLFIILYAAAIAGFVFSLILLETWHSWAPITLLIISSVWLLAGWIPFLGLKILKPQEALVLTLFGRYVGTLEKRRFLLCESLLLRCEPGGKNPAESKR